MDRATECSSSTMLVWMRAHRSVLKSCNLHPGIEPVVIVFFFSKTSSKIWRKGLVKRKATKLVFLKHTCPVSSSFQGRCSIFGESGKIDQQRQRLTAVYLVECLATGFVPNVVDHLFLNHATIYGVRDRNSDRTFSMDDRRRRCNPAYIT